MKQKPHTNSNVRLFSTIVILSLLLPNWGGKRISSLFIQTTTTEGDFALIDKIVAQEEYTINPGNYEIPQGLLTVIKTELGEITEASGGATVFGVGYYEEHLHWAWINLLVANGSYFSEEDIGPSFLYFGVKDQDMWHVVFSQKNDEYQSLLDSVQRDKLNSGENKLLDGYYGLNHTETNVFPLAGGLLFPWSSSQNSWRFSSNGFHPAGFQLLGVEQGAEAIDLLPPSSAQPARAVAMESGTVVNKLECTWNTVLVVRHDGYPDPARFLYLHIQNGTSPVGIGSVIYDRGQYLGNLRTPVFNGYWSNGVCSNQGSGGFNCERDINPATNNLCSSSTARHLHLGFGIDRSIVIDGNVVANLSPGSSYNSTNTDSVCPAPLPKSPDDGYTSSSQTITFSWSAVTGCGSGYTFRIKDTSTMDSGGTVVDGIDHGVGGTSTSETISSQWNNRDLYWGVKVANAPNANWSVRKFRIQPGSQTGNWTADYYDTTGRWFDTNNSSNFKCSENIIGLTLDKNYGTGAPCSGMDGETWVGDYNSTINFSSANYVFQVEHDDGLKLWLNNQNIADRGSSGADYICPPRQLSGNNNLRVMLREDGGDAKVKVSWTTDTSVCSPDPPLLTLNLGNTLRDRPVTIELRYPLLEVLGSFRTWSTKTDADGNITNFPLTDANPGTTYNLLIKPQGWLRKQTQVTLTSGTNSFDLRSNLPGAGDIDGNNKVNILDYQLLSNSFGKSQGQSGYNQNADLNGDNAVNILDFQLLSNSFGETGEGDEITPDASATLAATNTPEGQLNLAPSTNTPQVGEVITLNLDFDTATLAMAGLDAMIDYDQCVIEPITDQITHSGTFATTVVSSTPGTLEYQAHKWTGVVPGSPVSGAGHVASIPFKVIASVPSSTNLAIRFRPGSAYLSNMARDDIVQPFLGSVGNAVLYPTGATQRPSQTAQILSPSTGETINQNYVLLQAQVLDPCNGILKVIFSVFYDGQWHPITAFNTGMNGWAVYWDASQVTGQVIKVKAFAGDFAGNGVESAVNSNIKLDRQSANNTTFADVQTNYWAWDFVERLYAAGITGGCSVTPLSYCPENQVTRAQMAVFLERGINGSSYAPPAVGASTGFNDVPTSYWSAAWIKQLAADNITSGCGIGFYCPEDPVTRAQMAVFLLKSKYGSGYTPPVAGSSTGFTDVPTIHWAASWIKQLAAEGITGGCGTGIYCPESPVTRAQMAVFLVKTFALP